MATVSTEKRTIEVKLIRPDEGPQTVTLPEGSTLADLIRDVGAGNRGTIVQIDGRPIEESTILQPGMTVTVDVEEASEPSNGSWRATVGRFSHPDFLREVIAEGRAIREADREAAREEAEKDDR